MHLPFWGCENSAWQSSLNSSPHTKRLFFLVITEELKKHTSVSRTSGPRIKGSLLCSRYPVTSQSVPCRGFTSPPWLVCHHASFYFSGRFGCRFAMSKYLLLCLVYLSRGHSQKLALSNHSRPIIWSLFRYKNGTGQTGLWIALFVFTHRLRDEHCWKIISNVFIQQAYMYFYDTNNQTQIMKGWQTYFYFL